MDTRTEFDFLGKVQIPKKALYGINAFRARENFPSDQVFHPEWYSSMGEVKLACYRACKSFLRAKSNAYPEQGLSLSLPELDVLEAMERAAIKISQGLLRDQFIVPAIQGGAGTAINMNINEIIANAALVEMGKTPGSYKVVDPFEDANIFQSTNDVVPTALRLATIRLLGELEKAINALRAKVEQLEKNNRSVIRSAYTQMQQAVPSSYGLLFSAYSEALSRDWWRVSKAFERIKVVNLGGGAVGTGIATPRYFIMEVVGELQKLTGLPVSRSENLVDTTQNLDAFVEVHAILKANAVNLEKMASDMRLLASDICGGHEISIPTRQTGSSIMPGKVNPVIPEFVISSVHKIYANDILITSLCGQSSLDLNAYLPMIGHALIESLKMLINACVSIGERMFDDLEVNADNAYRNILSSPVITTALLPYIGYRKSTVMAAYMRENHCSVTEANSKLKIINDVLLSSVLKPENLLKLGFSLKDIVE